jgi:hypothetical protein
MGRRAAVEERLRTLSPEQYQILAVHTQEQMTQAMLFKPASLATSDRDDFSNGTSWAKKAEPQLVRRSVNDHRQRSVA